MATKTRTMLQDGKSGRLPRAFNGAQKRNPMGLFSGYGHMPDEYDNKNDMRLVSIEY